MQLLCEYTELRGVMPLSVLRLTCIWTALESMVSVIIIVYSAAIIIFIIQLCCYYYACRIQVSEDSMFSCVCDSREAFNAQFSACCCDITMQPSGLAAFAAAWSAVWCPSLRVNTYTMTNAKGFLIDFLSSASMKPCLR